MEKAKCRYCDEAFIPHAKILDICDTCIMAIPEKFMCASCDEPSDNFGYFLDAKKRTKPVCEQCRLEGVNDGNDEEDWDDDDRFMEKDFDMGPGDDVDEASEQDPYDIEYDR